MTHSPTLAAGEEILGAYRRHLSSGRVTLAQLLGGIVEARSSGSRVYDLEGKPYLDCGGYGVFLLGHRHPAVVDAVRRQLDRHPLATNLLPEPQLAEAAQRLAAVTPPGLDKVYFSTSGAEAVEAALKLARAHGNRSLIAMRGGYHGKTLGALSATCNPVYQDPFRPLFPVEFVPFGDVAALQRALDLVPDAAVLLEPVQGEGGVVIPPAGYLEEVRVLCTEHRALLIADEIQTGLGRLGTWWGVSLAGVVPDILLAGKVLSGGVVPVAAAVATAEVFEPFSADPAQTTTTFAGAPLAMAAATATLKVLAQDGLIERAAHLGDQLLAGIRAVLTAEIPHLVREVRGRGLLIGIELAAPDLVIELVLELLERGVLVNHSAQATTVLRLTPPAILDDDDVTSILSALSDASQSVRSRLGATYTP